MTAEAAFNVTAPKGVVLPTAPPKVIFPVPLVNPKAWAPSKVELNPIFPAVAPVVIETEPVVKDTRLPKVTFPPAPAVPPVDVPAAPPVVLKVDPDSVIKLLLPAVMLTIPPAPPLNASLAAPAAPFPPTAVIDPTVIAPLAVVIVTSPALPPLAAVVEVADVTTPPIRFTTPEPDWFMATLPELRPAAFPDAPVVSRIPVAKVVPPEP